jgi:hypothetical protein
MLTRFWSINIYQAGNFNRKLPLGNKTVQNSDNRLANFLMCHAASVVGAFFAPWFRLVS